MSKPLLDLHRLWRDFLVAPESDARGYLGIFADRDDHSSLAHFGFHQIDSLAKHECLFLLGRPGAGKSAEIKRIEQGGVAGFQGEWIVTIRCKEAGIDLHPEIVREPKWSQGFQQTKPVRLVLDGLDEGFLREPAYFSRLKRTLELLRSEYGNFRLLLTCRPAEWDKDFGASVHELWHAGGKHAVFALEQLSPKNQRALVEHWNGPGLNEFFRWVRQNRFEEFAAWPRSLEWLADQFRLGRGENLTYTELCRLRVARSFGEDKRYVEACLSPRAEARSHAIMLIAATLVFCGRKGIALDRPEPDCLLLDDIFREATRLEVPGKPTLTREDVIEAVRTSHLLETRGDYHCFENQSDLEFLAGAMLASFTVEQLEELFGCPDHDGCWRVFSQLVTTAANLAAQSPHFFAYLLSHDPRVLMRVDFASKSSDDRSAAVDAILNATARTGATGEHEKHAHFSTLSHEKITAQLRPWLFDQKKSPVVRELAFDIACQCCEGNFWLEFERAAADGDEFAARWLPSVILRFGANWPEERLLSWAGQMDDNLAGAALDALLNRGQKPRDLARFLRELSSEAYGFYHLHLNRLKEECAVEDVPAVLAAISEWPSIRSIHGRARDLLFALIAKGVTGLDRRDVRTALTKFIIARFKDHDWLLEQAGPQCGMDDASSRRALLLALAEDWPADTGTELMPFSYRLQREDYSWLLDQLTLVQGTAAVMLAKFAAGLVWQFDETQREHLEQAYARSPEFRALLPKADEAGIFATLRRLRAELEERHRLRMEELRAGRQDRQFSHAAYLAEALARCRAGDFRAWTDVCFGLAQSEDEQDGSEFFHNTDPRQLKGWAAASEELRAEMTEFARQFLLHLKVELPDAKSIPGDFFGLVYAVSLHANRLGEDAELRAAAHPVWPLAILWHYGSEDKPLAVPLAALTAAAPDVVAHACRHEFRVRWERNETICGQLLPAAWCAETENALVEVLSGVPLQPETYMSGLALLADHNAGLAKRFAERRLQEYVAQPDDSAARRAAIAGCLFVIDELWEKAWPHFVSDRAFARALLLEYSRWLEYHQREQRIDDLPVKLIAALYAFMIEVFPVSEAPRHEGSYTPNSVDNAYDLRGRLQRTLEARGAHEELSAIYRQCSETRESWWPKLSIDRAQSISHAARREAPTAAQFIRFLATEGGTFVSDNDSLQRAAILSLRRFEQNLKPDGLLAIWERGEPRSEEVLQVEITRHLRREFEGKRIVVNMEVKILRKRSDIRVEAGSYVVTLEVKLGHSSDRDRPLRTAMRSQLRTYLENQNETHGIYVVGWFFCPAFQSSALRDMKTLSSARRYFESQARKLSTSGFVLSAEVIDCRWPAATSSRPRKQKLAHYVAEESL